MTHPTTKIHLFFYQVAERHWKVLMLGNDGSMAFTKRLAEVLKVPILKYGTEISLVRKPGVICPFYLWTGDGHMQTFETPEWIVVP